ncbi:hypothetical protein HX037_04945 [Ignatzschineria indica]|uniref:hypothetical protein n=1 Tax=Ignatzschineria indica TaxID=472583 RepID=UPI0025760F71|nr:hypothetical protein [Ignatzschineria indica]MDM1545228.1 hypothetical protein [Ignatzschineria indica]
MSEKALLNCRESPYIFPPIPRRQLMIFYHQLFFEMKRLNGAGPHYRVLPYIARRQRASSMPNGGHALAIRAK